MRERVLLFVIGLSPLFPPLFPKVWIKYGGKHKHLDHVATSRPCRLIARSWSPNCFAKFRPLRASCRCLQINSDDKIKIAVIGFRTGRSLQKGRFIPRRISTMGSFKKGNNQYLDQWKDICKHNYEWRAPEVPTWQQWVISLELACAYRSTRLRIDITIHGKQSLLCGWRCVLKETLYNDNQL